MSAQLPTPTQGLLQRRDARPCLLELLGCRSLLVLVLRGVVYGAALHSLTVMEHKSLHMHGCPRKPCSGRCREARWFHGCHRATNYFGMR